MRKFRLVRVTWFSLLISISCLSFGQSVSSNPTKSAFLKDLDAARAGDHEAKIRVARAYNEGTVVWRNAPEAVWWFQQASDEGSIEASAWLGALYLFGGDNVPRDLERSNALLQKAVDANNPVGLRFMAAKYESGIGTAKDPAKAVEFYSRAISQNDTESYARLGHMYRGGLGVPKDPEKAFNLFSAGAQLGEQWSQLNLGQMYAEGFRPSSSSHPIPSALRGQSQVPNPDYEKAREMFIASAAQGNRVAEYELGRLYELGLDIPHDYAQSFEFYKQSSMQRFVPALLALGKAHELGRGTPINLLHAHVAYSLAIEYSGGRSGVKELQHLESKLSPAEVQKAQDHLKAFKEASEAAFGRSLK